MSIFRDVTPAWQDFCLATAGTYLGVQVGPGATPTSQWASALGKLRSRTRTIAAAGLSATRGFYEFSMRAIPTISYVAQVCEPPRRLDQLDRQLRTQLIHAPYNAIPPTALRSLLP